MGLNIWHELDIHRYPVSQQEEDTITRWAAIGKSELLADSSKPDISVLANFVLQEKLTKTPHALTRFIGFTIGMHAGRERKPIASRDDSGYELPTFARIRPLKVLGRNAAELNPEADFISVFEDTLHVAQGNTQTQLKVAQDFLGYGMGFREARIVNQGVEV